MMNKSVAILIAALISVASHAQDPGFRAPEASNRQPAAAPSVAATSGPQAAMLTSMDSLDNSRPIQPGYIISLRIVEDRKDAVQNKVAVTGEVNVPYIGLVKAAGRSCRELAYAIKRDLEKSYFISATVLIAIDVIPPEDERIMRGIEELESYTMFGFVMKQGKYDLPKHEDLTISQAILRAGGFAQFADVKHVKIVRNTKQGEKSIMVNVDSIMRKGLLQNDIFLRRNDVIIVPEKKINF